MTSEVPETKSHHDGAPGQRPKGGLIIRIGIMLMVVSCLLWIGLFAIPFLPMTLGQKATVAGVDFALVQICWWSGAAMVGPQTVSRLRAWRGKWTRKSGKKESA